MRVRQLKPKKCVVCQQAFTPFRPLQVACSIECAAKYGKAKAEVKRAKERVQAKKEERARHIARKHQLETVPELIKKAQQAFNAYIRARDRGKPCISCGAPLRDGGRGGGDYDAGHYCSVASAGHLRFDEANCHGQCKHCNRYLSGNVVAYRAGLIERIGLAEVERLECDNAPRKWDKDALRELAMKYRKMARELGGK